MNIGVQSWISDNMLKSKNCQRSLVDLLEKEQIC